MEPAIRESLRVFEMLGKHFVPLRATRPEKAVGVSKRSPFRDEGILLWEKILSRDGYGYVSAGQEPCCG